MQKADVKRWRSDIVAWAEECVRVRDPRTGRIGPLELFPHQKEFLRQATLRKADGDLQHRVSCCSLPKRCGKSLMSAVIGAHRLAVRGPGERVVVLANSEWQAESVVYDQIVDIFTYSPMLQGLVPASSMGKTALQVPALDNRCTCTAANWRTLQGLRITCLLCDELHATEDQGRSYLFASQQTEQAGAQVVISSQAGSPDVSNPLWRLYQAAETVEHIYFQHLTDPTLTPWAARLSAQALDELLPSEYDYLWRNLFSGGVGAKLFSAAMIEAAVGDWLSPQTRFDWDRLLKDWGDPAWSAGIGLDRAGPGSGGSNTIWTAVVALVHAGQLPVFRVLVSADLPHGAEEEIMAVDQQTLDVLGCQRPERIFEQYDCSDLAPRFDAELMAPTPGNQRRIFGLLWRLLSEGRLEFAADMDDLKTELLRFESTVSGGVTRFGTQAGKDDRAYSLAYAVLAAAEAAESARGSLVEARVYKTAGTGISVFGHARSRSGVGYSEVGIQTEAGYRTEVQWRRQRRRRPSIADRM